MTRISRSPGFLGAPLGAAALSAVAVFLLLTASPIDASAGAPRKHSARSEGVTLDGELAKEGGGWVIRLKALNPWPQEQRCQVATSLTHRRVNPMARVPPMPQIIWRSSMVLTVPPSNVSDQTLRIPADVAERIHPSKNNPNAPPLETSESFDVQVQANCAATGSHPVG